ncbi:MAG: response regulator [Oscillatoriales cyanobacterium]|nr:MAG: response regulator [Oscillatoriales cyanobacterium]
MADALSKSPLHALLVAAQHQQATGYLVATIGQDSWKIWLQEGQWLWAEGVRHRARRWQRATAMYRTASKMGGWNGLKAAQKLAKPDSLWEIACLQEALEAGHLGVEQVREAIARVAVEVCFLIDRPETQFQWVPEPIACWDGRLLLTSEIVSKVLKRSDAIQCHWQRSELQASWVDRGWYLVQSESQRQTPTTSLLNFAPLLNGQRTFWDVAKKLDPDGNNVGGVVKIFQLLWQQQQLITMKLPDLPLYQTQAIKRPLLKVACIDDDRFVCETIEKIIHGEGHEFIGCFNPIEALSKVIEAKPDVIFLDLVMPVVNGHELCRQLRRVSNLSHTSIVVCTGADGLIDRAMAKLSGATYFLSKPITPVKVLRELARHQQSQVIFSGLG